MKRIFASSLGRITIALLLTALFLAACAFILDIDYMTNDDNGIAFELAGYKTGSPYPYAMFINFLYGMLVSALYTLVPSVAWWGVLQVIELAVSGTILLWCVLKTGEDNDRPFFVRLVVCGILLVFIFLRCTVRLTYTTTAAVMGASGVALLLTASKAKTKGARIISDLIAFTQIVFAFLIREETGFAILCFAFLAVLYRIFSESLISSDKSSIRKNLRSVGVTFLAVLVLIGAAFAGNNRMKVTVNGEEHMTYFAVRERFTDYPRDSYYENPALYEQAGWNENVYNLANDWCFLDERIDAESLDLITTNSVHTDKIGLFDAVRMTAETFDESKQDVLLCEGVLCLLLIAGYSFLTNGHRGGAELLTMLLAVLGCAVLCFYLSFTGRAPMRALRTVLIPTSVVLAVLFFRVPLPDQKKMHRAATKFITVLAVLAVLLGGVMTARELRNSGASWSNGKSRALYAYTAEHRENVYIRDAYSFSDQDVFTTYTEETMPINLLSWGGCGMRSESYRQNLSYLGIDPDDKTFFLDDNVFFVASPWREDLKEMYERYLIEEHGVKGLEQVDTIPDVATIYRVVK